MPVFRPAEIRFWEKVNKHGPLCKRQYGRGRGEKLRSRCWLWTAYRNPDGYGWFGNGERMVFAHRYSWELVNGPIPDDLESDHLCRNRGCVNPRHIRLVSTGENTRRGLRGSRIRLSNEPAPVWSAAGRSS